MLSLPRERNYCLSKVAWQYRANVKVSRKSRSLTESWCHVEQKAEVHLPRTSSPPWCSPYGMVCGFTHMVSRRAFCPSCPQTSLPVAEQQLLKQLGSPLQVQTLPMSECLVCENQQQCKRPYPCW